MVFLRLILIWKGLLRIFTRIGSARASLTEARSQESLSPQVGLEASDEEKLCSPALVKASLSAPWLKGEIIQEMQRFVQGQRSEHTKRAYEGDLKQFIGYLRAEKE